MRAKTLPLEKDPGSIRTEAAMLRRLGDLPVFLGLLTGFYNGCFQCGCFPKNWKVHRLIQEIGLMPGDRDPK